MANFPHILSGANAVTPSAAAGITLTTGGAAWTYGSYVTVLASASGDQLLTGISITPPVAGGLENGWELELATGAASSEVAIATIPGMYGNGAWSTITSLSFPFPIPIASGTRIAARVRRADTSTTTVLVSIRTVNASFDGETYPTTALISCLPAPGSAVATVTTGGSAWANGTVVQLSASLPSDSVIFAVAASPNSLGWSAQWELDVCTGASSSEVTVSTIRESNASYGDPGWRLLPAPIKVASATRLSLRLRGSSASVSLLVKIMYYVNPGTDVPVDMLATAAPTIFPAASGALTVTSNGTSWGSWVQFSASTAQDLAVIDIASNGADTDGQIQIGVGAASSEVPIATLAFGGDNSSFRQGSGLPLPIGIAMIPSGSRVAMRTRDSNTPSGFAFALICMPVSGLASLRQTTAPAVTAPDAVQDNAGNTVGRVLAVAGTTWNNGAWTEMSSALSADGAVYGIAWGSSFNAQFEVDLGVGAASSEVVRYTWRGLSGNSGRRVILSDLLIAVQSGQRIALRVRTSATSGVFGATFLYYSGLTFSSGSPAIQGIQAEGLFIGESSHMRQITKDSTDQSVVVRFLDEATGVPVTTITSASAGLDLKYRREGATAVSLTESDLSALSDAHSDGGMLHIGSGYYRVDLPDAAVVTGADGVLVFGVCDDMVVVGCYAELVDHKLDAAGLVAIVTAMLTADLDDYEDVAEIRTVVAALSQLINKVAPNGNYLETFMSDGTTVWMKKLISVDNALEPIESVGGVATP